MSVLLDVQGVGKAFPTPDGSSLRVLDAISFGVSEGEFVCVVGPSGCGKTTLLQIIDGLLPPTDGRVVVDGTTITAPQKQMVVVFQQYTKSLLFPIVVNTIQGVAGVDRVLLDTARTFGLTTREILWKIVLPSASPSIVAGMRIALGIALILTVISEFVGLADGIGGFILDMERSFHIPEMWAGVFTLMVVGYLLNRLFVVFESRTFAWYFGQSRRAQE